MALTPSTIGDNPQQPMAFAETYLPDQLIAGKPNLIVTDTVTIGGSAVLQRGSLLGQIAEGTVTASKGTAQATGTITVTTAGPVAGDTLTIQGTSITFVAANPYGNQVEIDPNGVAANTALNLLALLVSSTDSNLSLMTYSMPAGGTEITATARIAGTGGNAYTLATSDSSAFTLSGATLSGGVANTGNATVSAITLGTSFKPGTYKAVCLTATTATVTDPNGSVLGTATFGTAFSDPQIGFTITAGGTACVAGDTFLFNAAAGSGNYVLSNASATDGSQVPLVILADIADPTSGPVTSGVYLAGEFNTNAMTFGEGWTPTNTKMQLGRLGIRLKVMTGGESATDPN